MPAVGGGGEGVVDGGDEDEEPGDDGQDLVGGDALGAVLSALREWIIWWGNEC